MAHKESRASIFYFSILCLVIVVLVALGFFVFSRYSELSYSRGGIVLQASDSVKEPVEAVKIVKEIKHVSTPEPLRAIYMTSWVAGTDKWMKELVDLVDSTELNALVVDIKDYTGAISYEITDENLLKFATFEPRIPDIESFISYLHDRNIYVIGRVSVFQDPMLVKKRPDLAVKEKSNPERIWKDYKGISWLDAGAVEVWDYAVMIAQDAYKRGFDEINFDYIRFPSDGDMKNIYFPWSGGDEKHLVLREFFKYLHEKLSDQPLVMSADLFGLTTTDTRDLNIGQILEDTFPYFDFVAPMVYPSHYPNNFNGFPNPAEKPYELIHYVLESAVRRAEIASTSPHKIRPWLQDFNLGATYDAVKVRAQIQATYDVGLTSWMLWSAANRYTKGALLPK